MQTIKDIDVKNKRVIVRADYNVPIKDGKILDNNRIVESLVTINYLIKENATIILMSHMGKIKTIEDKENNSLLPVKEELERLLNKKVKFSSCLKGEELESTVSSLKPTEILLLENTRFMDLEGNLESGCDENLSKYWATLADVFVLDAFGSAHRAHASTYGISKYLPHAIGFLVEKEVNELRKIKEENKTLILGGAKVSDKIGLIKNLLPSSNKVLIGGLMSATFLSASGVDVKGTFVDTEHIEEAKDVLKTGKIVLPVDVVTESGIHNVNEIPVKESIFDVGPKTLELFKQSIDKNNLVLLNGTMGKYEEEKYENGTKEIFDYLRSENIKVVVCGGDGSAASKKFKFNPYYLSTGGGASLEYLEGKELLPLKIMK